MPPPTVARNHSQSLVEAGPSNAGQFTTTRSPLDPMPPSTAAAHAQGHRQASKAYSTALAARNNDVKYKAKYRELKKKVKEIEQDNDRLQVHLLRTKKNIQRLRLERAILYERLAALGHQVPLQGSPPHPQLNLHTRLPYDPSAKEESAETSVVEQPTASRDPHGDHPPTEHSILPDSAG